MRAHLSARATAVGSTALLGMGLVVAPAPAAAPSVLTPTASASPASCQTTVPGLAKKYQPKAATKQVVVAAGDGWDESWSTVTRWQKSGKCWTKVGSVRARNGANGWHKHPWDGSLYSPVGRYGLTDAGGKWKNPGTKMRYWRNKYGYYHPNPNIFGYVIAVNFNRRAGHSPEDNYRPNPKIPDGGIWIHVWRDRPTRGCVSMSAANMRTLLRWLKPKKKPVIVMGPASELATG